MVPQYDQVRGEFPAQHPYELKVGAGGAVVVGGSVNVQSSSSPPSIHEHTPADSQSSPLSKSLQNEKVLAEYPVQQPSVEWVGAGGVVVVGGSVCKHSSTSSVGTQSQFAAASHALSSARLKQNALNGSSP
jgi:hypothetical protein